ncbi:hypothetical protein DR950_08090 [Kitasatospora xanthocidica]|uniref:Uncharacterized protein n=1 Tax=Kitasatospora xanthocidica TaxID=83382 RepID=A0A372ZPF6_9ACTN|nr:hypothetical protein [Kitasatospora xanthocidica]RGD57753.1 hypothetical protein DR950_08090 [Kitasatospora xanthocidica]
MPHYWGMIKEADVGTLRTAVQVLTTFEGRYKQQVTAWQTMQRTLASSSWHGQASDATTTALQNRTNQLLLVDQFIEDLRRMLTDGIDSVLLLQARQQTLITRATGNCLEIVAADVNATPVVRVLPPDQHSRNDPEWRKEVEAARDRLVTDIDALCTSARGDDDRLARALAAFDYIAKQDGDYYPEKVAEITKAVAELDRMPGGGVGSGGGNPDSNRAWWDSLPEATRQQLIQDHPGKIGSLNGLPAEVRDQANRAWLPQLREEMARELTGPRSQNITQANLDGLDALQKQIDTPGTPPQLLLSVDDPRSVSHVPGAVLAYGNPDTATHIAAYVPPDPAVGTLPADAAAARNLAVAAGKADPTKPTASIVFTNLGPAGDPYQTPTASLSPLRDGGQTIHGTYNGLRASHRDGNATLSEVAAPADGSGFAVASTPLADTGKPGWSFTTDSIVARTPGGPDDPSSRHTAANAIVGRR